MIFFTMKTVYIYKVLLTWDHESNFHYTWYGNIAKKLEGKGKGQKKHTSTPIKIFFEHFIAFNFVTHDCHDCQEHHA